MAEFLTGVVSSLVATVLTVATASLVSARTRKWLTTLVSRWAGLPVHRVYKKQSSANATLRAEINRARWVRVLTGRGNELTRDSFSALWAGKAKRVQLVQILLPDPTSARNSGLVTREADVRRFDPGVGVGSLARQVRVNAEYIRTAAFRRTDVNLRFYNLPNTCRVIVTDRVAYITLYSSSRHGRNSPCIVARKPGLMYDFALLVFSTAWNCSTELEAANGTAQDETQASSPSLRFPRTWPGA